MKKRVAVLLALVVFFGLAPVQKVYAAGSAEDTVVDKIGDWFAVIGKSGQDRDAILAQRKMDRATQRLSGAMKESGQKAGKEMDKMGKEMGKMFGN